MTIIASSFVNMSVYSLSCFSLNGGYINAVYQIPLGNYSHILSLYARTPQCAQHQ